MSAAFRSNKYPRVLAHVALANAASGPSGSARVPDVNSLNSRESTLRLALKLSISVSVSSSWSTARRARSTAS